MVVREPSDSNDNPATERLSDVGAGELVAVIGGQHVRIERLMVEVLHTSGPEQQVVFDQFRRFLALHEAAEQVLVRPVALEVLPDDAVSRQRITEEQDAAAVVAHLETLVGSDVFDVQFGLLREAVTKHAKAEEQEELPKLVAALPDRALSMAVAGLGKVEPWATDTGPGSALDGTHDFEAMFRAASAAFVSFAAKAG
jgi:hypothetical protein